MTATAEAVTHLSVGDGISTYEQMLALPIGTLIGPDTRRTHQKVDVSAWENTSDGSLSHYTSFALRGNRVQSLPPADEQRLMTLRQWQWRFLDHIWWAGEVAGTGEGPILDAQRALRLDDDLFPLGAGVRFKSSHTLWRLREGTVAYSGKPEDLPRFGVFRLDRNHNWRHLLGDTVSPQGALLTILSVPTGLVADWATAPGTEREQEAIAEFKAHAWRVGWRTKSNHRWCSTYETYMSQIGLTAAVLTEATHDGVAVHDRVPPDQAATLPQGSVLRWRKSDGKDWAWFIRDDGEQNRAKTRRLFGERDGSNRNYSSSMEVLWINHTNDPLSVVASNEEIEALPPGSRIEMDGSVYLIAMDQTITHDSRVVPATGIWRVNEFRSVEKRVVSVP